MDKKTEKILIGGGVLALAGYGLHRLLAKAGPPGPPGPGTASIYGVVTDSETGAPIPDVLIYEPWESIYTYTDANGYYELLNLLPGDYELLASEAYGRYQAVTMTVSVGEGVSTEVNFSMVRILPADKAILRGEVIDAVTKLPVPNGYDAVLNGYTDSTFQGIFRIEDIEPGTYSLTVSGPGHEPYQATVTLKAGEIKTLPIEMVSTYVALGFSVRFPEPIVGATHWRPTFEHPTVPEHLFWEYDPGWIAFDDVWYVPEDPNGSYIRIRVGDVPNEVMILDVRDLGPVYDGKDYVYDWATASLKEI